jgi:hypothetical protein
MRVSFRLRMGLLELGHAFQFVIPSSFELTGDQAIVRVDAFILPLRQAGVVPCLFQLQLPLSPLAGQVVFNLIEHLHRHGQALRRHGLQERLHDPRVHRARGHTLTNLGIAITVALLTHVDRRPAFVLGVVLDPHRATAAATDDEPLQEGGPFTGDASTAVAIPVLT